MDEKKKFTVTDYFGNKTEIKVPDKKVRVAPQEAATKKDASELLSSSPSSGLYKVIFGKNLLALGLFGGLVVSFIFGYWWLTLVFSVAVFVFLVKITKYDWSRIVALLILFFGIGQAFWQIAQIAGEYILKSFREWRQKAWRSADLEAEKEKREAILKAEEEYSKAEIRYCQIGEYYRWGQGYGDTIREAYEKVLEARHKLACLKGVKLNDLSPPFCSRPVPWVDPQEMEMIFEKLNACSEKDLEYLKAMVYYYQIGEYYSWRRDYGDTIREAYEKVLEIRSELAIQRQVGLDDLGLPPLPKPPPWIKMTLLLSKLPESDISKQEVEAKSQETETKEPQKAVAQPLPKAET